MTGVGIMDRVYSGWRQKYSQAELVASALGAVVFQTAWFVVLWIYLFLISMGSFSLWFVAVSVGLFFVVDALAIVVVTMFLRFPHSLRQGRRGRPLVDEEQPTPQQQFEALMRAQPGAWATIEQHMRSFARVGILRDSLAVGTLLVMAFWDRPPMLTAAAAFFPLLYALVSIWLYRMFFRFKGELDEQVGTWAAD